MQHTDNIVYIFLVDWNPVVSCLQDLIDDLLERLLNIDGHHISSRHHDLTRGAVVKCEHGIDHLPLVIVKRTALISHLQKRLDFFLGNRFLLILRLHVKDPQHQLGGYGKQFDKR